MIFNEVSLKVYPFIALLIVIGAKMFIILSFHHEIPCYKFDVMVKVVQK